MQLVENLFFDDFLESLLADGRKRVLGDRAGVALLVALMAVPLIAVLGLAVEVTGWQVTRQEMQRAADMAALAAAEAYNAGATAKNAAFAGAYVAEMNGQAGAATRTWSAPTLSDGTITITKVAGIKSASDVAFQTTITKQESYTLSRIFLKGTPAAFAATAITELAPPTGNGQYCILALNNTAASANFPYDVNISNGATVLTPNCGIFSDGTGTSIDVTATVNAQTLAAVGTISCTAGGSCTGTHKPNQPNMANPYASIATPTPSVTCTATNPNYLTTQTISPGTYCGSLQFGNGGGAGNTVTMSPGLYVIDTNSNSIGQRTYPFYVGQVTLNASGVTIVITDSSTMYGYPPQIMATDNGANFNLTAPTAAQAATGGTSAGAMAGIAIWVDPAAPASQPTGTQNGQQMTVSEGSAAFINGAIVAPTQNISFTDGSTNAATTCLEVIAYTIVFAGGNQFTNSNCGNLGVTPIGAVSVKLVE